MCIQYSDSAEVCAIVSEGHKRRDGYWPYYRMGRKTEKKFLRRNIIQLIRSVPSLVIEKEKKYSGRKRGPTPVHSQEKLSFLCLMKISLNVSFEDVIEELDHVSEEWKGEPHPDVSWVKKHMQKLDIDSLDLILKSTAKMCVDELRMDGDINKKDLLNKATYTHISEAKIDIPDREIPAAHLAMDSSVVETDRLEPMEINRTLGDKTIQTRRKTTLKYHTAAITGHQIMLAAEITDSNVSDMVMLPDMTTELGEDYPELQGRYLNADKGYDSDENVHAVKASGFEPNIKQRTHAGNPDNANRDKPHRKEAAKQFDPVAYDERSLIEGIYGAEETKNHNLHCKMRKTDNRRRFGKVRVICWNLKVLNRFICAHRLGYVIPPYGKHS